MYYNYNYNNIDNNKIMGNIVELDSVNYKIFPFGTSTLKAGSTVKVDYVSLDLAFVTEVCSGLSYCIDYKDLGKVLATQDTNLLPLKSIEGNNLLCNNQLLYFDVNSYNNDKVEVELDGKKFLVNKDKVDDFFIDDIKCEDDDYVNDEDLISFTSTEEYNEYSLKDKLKTSQDIIDKAIEITNNCKTDEDKAKSIYLWISKNIKYDDDLYKSCNFPKNEAIETLNKRKGICLGYATLFCDMCKAVGLHSQLIKGDLYNGKDRLGGHAWNRVLVNGRFIGVDCTLSSDLYEEINYFVQKDSLDKSLMEAFQSIKIDNNCMQLINTDGYFDSRFFYKAHKNGTVIHQN